MRILLITNATSPLYIFADHANAKFRFADTILLALFIVIAVYMAGTTGNGEFQVLTGGGNLFGALFEAVVLGKLRKVSYPKAFGIIAAHFAVGQTFNTLIFETMSRNGWVIHFMFYFMEIKTHYYEGACPSGVRAGDDTKCACLWDDPPCTY